jgi:hypothetical protein
MRISLLSAALSFLILGSSLSSHADSNLSSHSDSTPWKMTLDPANVVALSMTYDPGDRIGSFVDEATPTQVVVFRDGTAKIRLEILGGAKAVTLPAATSSRLFEKASLGFLDSVIITGDRNSFPCRGTDSVGSSGLAATNYYVFVRGGAIGKDVQLPSGETVKQISFPATCMKEITSGNFAQYFNAAGRVVLREIP